VSMVYCLTLQTIGHFGNDFYRISSATNSVRKTTKKMERHNVVY